MILGSGIVLRNTMHDLSLLQQHNSQGTGKLGSRRTLISTVSLATILLLTLLTNHNTHADSTTSNTKNANVDDRSPPTDFQHYLSLPSAGSLIWEFVKLRGSRDLKGKNIYIHIHRERYVYMYIEILEGDLTGPLVRDCVGIALKIPTSRDQDSHAVVLVGFVCDVWASMSK